MKTPPATQAVLESLLCTALLAVAYKSPRPKVMTALATATVTGWRVARVDNGPYCYAAAAGNAATHLADLAIFVGLQRFLNRVPPASLLKTIGAGLGVTAWLGARIASEAIFEEGLTVGGLLVSAGYELS